MFMIARNAEKQDVIRYELTGALWTCAHNGFVNRDPLLMPAVNDGEVWETEITDLMGRVIARGTLTQRVTMRRGQILVVGSGGLVVGMLTEADRVAS